MFWVRSMFTTQSIASRASSRIHLEAIAVKTNAHRRRTGTDDPDIHLMGWGLLLPLLCFSGVSVPRVWLISKGVKHHYSTGTGTFQSSSNAHAHTGINFCGSVDWLSNLWALPDLLLQICSTVRIYTSLYCSTAELGKSRKFRVEYSLGAGFCTYLVQISDWPTPEHSAVTIRG